MPITANRLFSGKIGAGGADIEVGGQDEGVREGGNECEGFEDGGGPNLQPQSDGNQLRQLVEACRRDLRQWGREVACDLDAILSDLRVCSCPEVWRRL